MQLQDILPGSAALITALNVPEDEAVRLKAMGVCVGRRVQLVRAGDPLILRVLGTRIGISARLAAEVLVESIPAS